MYRIFLIGAFLMGYACSARTFIVFIRAGANSCFNQKTRKRNGMDPTMANMHLQVYICIN